MSAVLREKKSYAMLVREKGRLSSYLAADNHRYFAARGKWKLSTEEFYCWTMWFKTHHHSRTRHCLHKLYCRSWLVHPIAQHNLFYYFLILFQCKLIKSIQYCERKYLFSLKKSCLRKEKKRDQLVMSGITYKNLFNEKNTYCLCFAYRSSRTMECLRKYAHGVPPPWWKFTKVSRTSGQTT